MKYKTKNIIDKYILISMIFICLSIYLPPFFKSLSITFLASSIILAYLTKSYSLKLNLNFNRHNLLILMLYLLYVIGVFYSSDIKEAFFDLEVKLPIIIFPILFLFLPQNFLSKRKFWFYATAIISGLIINIFFCFISGIIRSINDSLPLIPEISYTKLTISSHPSYASLFSSIALILVYRMPSKELFKISKKTNHIIKAISFFIITVFLLMLKSRSGFIAMTIVSIWIIFDIFIIEKRKIVSLITLFLISILYITIFNLNQFSGRYYNAIDKMSDKTTTNQPNENSMSQRKFIYSNSLNIILEKPFFGYGTGDVKQTLNKLYNKEQTNFKSYLNAHDQFLQTSIALGLIGLILLMLVFILPIINMFNQKEYFLVTIFLIIVAGFLFESMLEREMGTYFFGLIYVLSNSYMRKDIELSEKGE